MVFRLSSFMILRTFYRSSSVRPVEGRTEPSESSTSTEVSPRLNRENRSKVCVLPMALSPKAVFVISCLSGAVFPSLRQNFKQMRCSFKSAISFITENRRSHLTHATINTRWKATQRVMAVKLTRLTHKIAIQLQVVAESCTICSSRSKRSVRKLLDTPSYYSVRNVCHGLPLVYNFMQSANSSKSYLETNHPLHNHKVNLCLCLTKHHTIKTYAQLPRHEDVWSSGGIAPHILNLGIKWKWVVSFTFRPPWFWENSHLKLESCQVRDPLARNFITLLRIVKDIMSV
jgi:hypothetical protein